jgi:hypothetical protein
MMVIQVINMGFGKAAISFILIAVFAVSMVGMASIMIKDKPTDAYYTNTSNTVSGSVNLVGTIFGVSSNIMIPIIAISGILVLFAGFAVLRKA